MTPRVDRLNRILLIVLGAAVVVLGAGVLLVGGGVFGTSSAEAPLVSGVVTDNVKAISGWFWPVLALVLLVVAGLGGWWAFAQPRTQAVSRVELERSPAGSVGVMGTALADCVQSDCESIAGVARARVRVSNDGDATLVGITVWVGAPFDLTSVVATIDNSVLPHLAYSLDGDQPRPIRTTVHLDTTTAPVTRLR